MKKILVTVLTLIGLSAQAQYFQHHYGTTTDDETLISGVNTFIQPQGHLMATNNINSSSSISNLLVTYTDVNGDILGAPNFNNEYSISSPITGVAFHLSSVKVFELNNGSGFGAIGLYNDGTSTTQGIFYLQLDASGNPITVYDYTAVPSTLAWYNLVNVAAIAKSPGNDDVYITGSTESSAAKNYVFALKINSSNGNLIWSSFYDVVQGGFPQKEFATDIIESPYSPSGQQEVVIIGGGYDYYATSTDGFLFRVDATTGLPVFNWAVFYGTSSTNEFITSIEIANSTAGGGNGFIISGTASGDFWLLKTDATGGVYWANVYDYAASPGNNDYLSQVIERYNTMGNYEYYACGYTTNGSFGGYDVVVIKTDDNGNGITGGEFTYNTGDNDMAYALDQYNGTPADGLSVYAVSYHGSVGGADEYLVKAYFNGMSGCNESFNTPNAQSGPGLYSETTITYFDNFTSSNLNVSQSTAADATLCFNNTIPGGSNARIAPTQPNSEKRAVVSPNPMEQGTNVTTIELESEAPSTVQLTIYDMLGKQHYNGTYQLTAGKNQLPVDVSNANMAAGMYTIKLSGAGINNTIMLMVK